MFSRPIVFVVGAGASAEFGLPVGADLKEKIASALDFCLDGDGRLIGDNDLYAMLSDRFGQELQKHQNAALELSRVLRGSEFESIDEVLHWFSSRHEIISLGKVTIVREILQAERTSRLFNSANFRLIPPHDYSDTWLPSFLSMAVGSLKREEISRAFADATVINFNYDRTIEHFLFCELQSKLQLDQDEAKQVVSGLKMIRPYGTVGSLDWEAQDGVPFGAVIGNDHKILFSKSESVYTYTEQKLMPGVEAEIRQAVERARLVVFLGFGFHQQNMNLLTPDAPQAHREVLATVVRLDLENYDNMRSYIARALRTASPPQLLDRTCGNLMRNMRPSLMNPSL